MVMEDKLRYNPSEEEKKIWDECMSDCLWYRSLPAAATAGKTFLNCIICCCLLIKNCIVQSITYSLLSGFGVLISHKMGTIKPTKFGIWPKVLSAGAIFYALAKASYLLGEECDNKFLKRAPRSEMAETIRFNRNNKERKIWMECMSEAFWYRALPATSIASTECLYEPLEH